MINNSIITSLVDSTVQSSLEYQHKLLLNNDEYKVITEIQKQLERCDEFFISVAFITYSGVTLLLNQLKELESKGIKGKILTGNYLLFTQPKALRKLMKFKNIELKMLTTVNLHAKGYFFRQNDMYNLVLGSSNLTQAALTVTQEWNIKMTSNISGKISQDLLEEFNRLFSQAEPIEKIIVEFTKLYEENKKNQVSNIVTNSIIKPNSMQEEALRNLRTQRQEGKNKSLIISATGTGKTYLAAFDVQQFNPKRCLFIVHRENIASKAKQSFQAIMPSKKYGMYTGNNKDEADFLFVTIQTLSKEKYLNNFKPDHFDYIIIDEVHHAGASSYKRVIDYFKPKFFLGMTATPERSDEIDIYSLFDHNIGYEIRLHDAMKMKLLTPFHYFAISELEHSSGEVIDSFNYLTSDQRIDHIIDKVNYYGYSGEKRTGLMFVSTVHEANEMAIKLTSKGMKSCALTGSTCENDRYKAIDELENGELEFIITVDIFNEGVDIPKVNQVVMLRPTESSIVYIQQLGRGLRLSKEKSHVVVLDFISNYNKNFLIPIALSQNNSYDKDEMRLFIENPSNHIPGECTINFDKISKSLIYENINSTNFSTLSVIKKDFNLLKLELGRTPMLYDFYTKNSIDPRVLLNYKNDYYKVLLSLKDSSYTLSLVEEKILEFITVAFVPAKRIYETMILDLILETGSTTIEEIVVRANQLLNNQISYESIENAIKHLKIDIFKKVTSYKGSPSIIKHSGELLEFDFTLSKTLRTFLEDIVKYNNDFYFDKYHVKGSNKLNLFKKYKRQDIYHIENYDFISGGINVGGYIHNRDSNEVNVFITIDDTSSFTSYDNRLTKDNQVTWFSKNNRRLGTDFETSIKTEPMIATNRCRVKIFIKKTSKEDFYYMGYVDKCLSAINTEANDSDLIKYELQLESRAPEELFNYLKGKYD